MGGHDGKIDEVFVAIVEHGVAVAHGTVVYVARLERLFLAVVEEMAVATDDVDNLRGAFVAVVTAGGVGFEMTHHNLVLAIDEVAGAEGSLASPELLDTLFFYVLVIDNHWAIEFL